tara:strand:- start:508 stop:2172 length:1665 start_codon:yes stop_codon:yes gene_type:complete
MKQKDKKISQKIIFLLFSTFFLVGLFTFKDYGISVDEEFNRISGLYWLNYILSFTSFDELKNIVGVKLNEINDFTLGPAFEVAANNPYYGVVFDLPLAFIEVIFKINDSQEYFYLRHLLTFILFFISTIFFYKLLLNRFLNYNIALIGTLFFVLSPRIYGDSFFNNKDIIFLSLTAIALYFCFKSLEKLSYKNLFIFAIFASLATAQRVLGIFLPISFIFFYILTFLSNNKNLKSAPNIIFFIVLYCLFSILFWPVLWSNPLEKFFLAFQYFSYHYLHMQMLFKGSYIYSNFLPYDYILTWVLISTPILYVTLFIVGYILIFKRFFIRFINIKYNKHYYDLWRGNNEKKDLFILFNFTFIIFYLATSEIVLYTGWRQVYFINIFIIYIAIFAFYQIDLNLKLRSIKKPQFIVISLCLVFIVYKMAIYHPYQNIYFNNFFNKNAHEKFEVDYWGLTGKKFLEYILFLEKDKNLIKIGTASFLPLERSTKLLSEKDRKKISIVGQNFQDADYLYTNFISEVDKNSNDKYKIPNNFSKINEFVLNSTTVYQVFKKSN